MPFRHHMQAPIRSLAGASAALVIDLGWCGHVHNHRYIMVCSGLTLVMPAIYITINPVIRSSRKGNGGCGSNQLVQNGMVSFTMVSPTSCTHKFVFG
ncbi:hypothetical protein EDD15DRAFT_501105 [Pisolithus albus]|nr:hypothetical protein EDD15DRAFT_501105 [Pisolithus albus]